MTPFATLVAAFFISLPLSLSGAQILAAVLILASLARGRGAFTEPAARFCAALAIAFIAPLTVLDVWHNGSAGILPALEHTWTVSLAFAIAVYAAGLDRQRLEKVWLLAMAAATAFFLIQYFLFGYAGVWKYGFQRSPYVFAMVLIAPSLYLMTAPAPNRFESILLILFSFAIVALQSRGAVAAWIFASCVVAAKYPLSYLLRRRSFWAVAAIVLIFVLSRPARWDLDLTHQSSIVHRLIVWSQVIEDIGERPLLGRGFDRYEPDLAAVAPEYRKYIENETNPHNGFLLAAHAGGLVGYAILCAVYSAAFFRLRRTRSRWAQAAAGYLVALAVGSLTDKTFFTTLPTLQLWALVGLALAWPPDETP